jgi:hypothetical protein
MWLDSSLVRAARERSETDCSAKPKMEERRQQLVSSVRCRLRCSQGAAPVLFECMKEIKVQSSEVPPALLPYAEWRPQATKVSLAEGGSKWWRAEKSHRKRPKKGSRPRQGLQGLDQSRPETPRTPGPLLASANCGALGKRARSGATPVS